MKELISDNPFEKLKGEVDAGIRGDNQSIPIGMPKLGLYLNFRPRIFTLLFSSSGAGKSSMADTMMLNACDYLIKYPEFKKRAKFTLFSMERSKHLRIAKWIIRKIFKEHGIVIQLPKLMGWWDQKLNKDEHDLFLMYQDYIDLLLSEYIDIYEGGRTPKDIYRIMMEQFEKTGKYESISEHKKIWVSNKPDEIVIPIIDHGNIIKTTPQFPTKKQAIDETVQYMQQFRDNMGASPLWVSQINRSLSGVSRVKDGEMEPNLEDTKESGDIGDACDIAFSIFDPVKFKQSSKTGYNPTDFIDSQGAKYFRSAMIHKSSYGEDDLRIPLAMNGFCGDFKELSRRNDLDEEQYATLIQQVKSKNYFK